FHESPGAPLDVLQSPVWNSPPAEATSLIEAGRKLQAARAQIDRQFSENVLDQEHAPDIAYVEQKTSGILGFLSFLDGRVSAIKRRWVSYRKPGYTPSLLEQANDLKDVDRYLKARTAFEGEKRTGRSLFGELWRGERSDWNALDRYVRWVVEVRSVC